MSAKDTYDVIVVGLGAMGSATLYQLAKRGLRVCGIERHNVAHDLGSSHGHVRMIRKAYFEHPGYVPLLEDAYRDWRTLEEESGESLLNTCGLLLSGLPDSTAVQGLETCYREHALPHERFDRDEALKRYPQFSLPEGFVSFYDPEGGYLFIERCIEQFLEHAETNGADVRIHTEAESWKADGEGVCVTTEQGDVHAAGLVLTVGPWAVDVMKELGVEVSVKRTPQFWYDTPHTDLFAPSQFPAFYVEHPLGDFYGFPVIGDEGLKVAKHEGGELVSDPDGVNRSMRDEEEKAIRALLDDLLPRLDPQFRHHSVCMYTLTPDEHFVLDTHPNHSNVVAAGGFSGHGFKFAPIVGEIMADMVLGAESQRDIGFLNASRFSKN